jgi:dihydroorotate dehydrogenase (NAD+) catalytic subunit
LRLKNPIIAASGVFGYGLELNGFCPPEALGAVIVKGLSMEPWPGNPAPRIAEAAGGLLNAIGLQNIGAKAFAKTRLKPLKAAGAVVGVNLIGETTEAYVKVASYLAGTCADFLELNISCPNLSSKGGLSFGADPDSAARLTEAVAKAVKGAKPLWVKLAPLVSDISALSKKVESAGADALSLINTLPGLAIDLETRAPVLGNVFGGLSGPPVKPLALRQVHLASKAVKIPVVGLGGIMTPEDALEFMVAGASAVQMGTAILAHPSSPLKVIEGVEKWLAKRSFAKAADLVGTLKTSG